MEQLTPRDLTRLSHAVADELERRLATQTPRRLLDLYQLSEALGLSTATVERLTANEKIPSIKIQRCRRYELDAVVEALRTPEPMDN